MPSHPSSTKRVIRVSSRSWEFSELPIRRVLIPAGLQDALQNPHDVGAVDGGDDQGDLSLFLRLSLGQTGLFLQDPGTLLVMDKSSLPLNAVQELFFLQTLEGSVDGDPADVKLFGQLGFGRQAVIGRRKIFADQVDQVFFDLLVKVLFLDHDGPLLFYYTRKEP